MQSPSNRLTKKGFKNMAAAREDESVNNAGSIIGGIIIAVSNLAATVAASALGSASRVQGVGIGNATPYELSVLRQAEPIHGDWTVTPSDIGRAPTVQEAYLNFLSFANPINKADFENIVDVMKLTDSQKQQVAQWQQTDAGCETFNCASGYSIESAGMWTGCEAIAVYDIGNDFAMAVLLRKPYSTSPTAGCLLTNKQQMNIWLQDQPDDSDLSNLRELIYQGNHEANNVVNVWADNNSIYKSGTVGSQEFGVKVSAATKTIIEIYQGDYLPE